MNKAHRIPLNLHNRNEVSVINKVDENLLKGIYNTFQNRAIESFIEHSKIYLNKCVFLLY